MCSTEDVQITAAFILLCSCHKQKPKPFAKKENNINTRVTEDLYYFIVLHTTQTNAMFKDTLRKLCKPNNIQKNMFNDGGTAP
jgi:hypothetical protein